jgi:RNA polymerase sigma factor (sigma-70 family)
MDSAHVRGALKQIHRLFEAGTVAGLTDGQLIERFLSTRDEDAFALLVGRHGPMVVAVCRTVLNDSPEVEDAFQATFLILIRRAGTIWRRDAVGGWLHRVAHRVAVQASRDRSRKKSLMGQVDDLSALVAYEDTPGHEDWPSHLHEEIARLPETLRLPVVLCHLEGKTHTQAALELRSSEATVGRRLARARELLRSRLTRRGVALPSGGLAGALARDASAAVPAGWIDTLTRFAGRVATGEAALGSAGSATSGRLAETLARSLLVGQARRLTIAAAVLVAAGLVAPHLVPAGAAKAGAGRPVRSARAVDSSLQVPDSRPPQPAAAKDQGRLLAAHGRVLDPDGKPVVGAKVYSYCPISSRGEDPLSFGALVPSATTGEGGEFQFRITDTRLQTLDPKEPHKNPIVVAMAPGFGPAWASIATINEAKDLTLRLVGDDVPIIGRVLDLEGRPIAGVTVRPVLLSAYPNEDLSAWEAAMARAKDINNNEAIRLPSRGLELFRWRQELAVTTGADGKFHLTGIGRERLVSLWFQGPTIVDSFIESSVRTRRGPTYRLPIQQDRPEFGALVYHGATFDHVAAPTRPIEGTVRDRDTGKPLAGISIRSDRFAGSAISGRDHVRATSSADGRYRLLGMPSGGGNVLTANPGPGKPWLGTAAEVPKGTAPQPANVDFDLKRGVAIRGKVVDKATGTPVPGIVEYFLFGDNPRRAEISQLHGGEVATGADGTFELIGLPGRGLVAARAAQDHYLAGQGAASIAGADEHGWFRTEPHICQPGFFHAVIAIEPAQGTDTLTCELAVDHGNSRAGTVFDPSGKPVAGCVAVSLCPATMSQHVDTLTSDTFTAIALDPRQGRHLFFRHHQKKLAAVVMAQGNENGPLAVRLQPAGTIVGRLVGDDGRLPNGLVIKVDYGPGQFADIPYYCTFIEPALGNDWRFRIEGLIAGVKYDLPLRVGAEKLLGRIGQGISLEPGETRDLGDVRVEPKLP